MKFGGPEIAFIEDPNGYKIELVQQKDSALIDHEVSRWRRSRGRDPP